MTERERSSRSTGLENHGLESKSTGPGSTNRKTPETTEVQLATANWGWKPELTRAVYAVLKETDRDRCAAELHQLEQDHGTTVYSMFFHLLAHLRFEPERARQHWNGLVTHWESLERSMGSTPDVRVALVSYFVDVARTFENPTIIEMHLLEEARDLAYRDELTGLSNYRYFSEALPHELGRSDQHGTPVSLVMLDVDNFKAYNDRFDHHAGNHALEAIGRLVQQSVRHIDIAVRYGGEEFALILPSTPKLGAKLIAERTRARIEQGLAAEMGLTVSLGVATYPGDAEDATTLMRNADRALYLAKETGKNRVCLYGESRRSHRRMEIEVEGTFGVLNPQRYPLKTINLSEAGLRFQTVAPVTSGSVADISLALPDGDLNMAARVTQVTCRESGQPLDVSARVLELSAAERVRLRRFVAAGTPATSSD